jgi:hypothetical protein
MVGGAEMGMRNLYDLWLAGSGSGVTVLEKIAF